MPERKCIVSGQALTIHKLIRFVVGPDGDIVPDLAQKLPGRGLWVTADRASLEAAVAKKAFARAARAPVKVSPQLPDQVADLLTRRALRQISLVVKAGKAVAGFDKVAQCIGKGQTLVLLEATDGAADGREKLVRLANSQGQRDAADGLKSHKAAVHVAQLLTSAELSFAFGRQRVIHAALKTAPVAKMALRDLDRLTGFRAMPE